MKTCRCSDPHEINNGSISRCGKCGLVISEFDLTIKDQRFICREIKSQEEGMRTLRLSPEGENKR